MAGTGTFDCYVANLPIDFTENDVRIIFNIAGEIVGVKLLPPKPCAEGKVAFVKFTTESDAHCCAQFMNNHPLEDGARILKVKYRPKSEESNGLNGHSQLKTTRINGERSSSFAGAATKGDEMDQVFVSHVESPIEFWAQSCTEAFAMQLHELTEEMEALCPSQPKVVGQLSTDKVYGCKFSEDGLWYRCVVEKSLAKDEVHVRYIDYGNSEVADRTDLVMLPNNIELLPPLSQCYQIDGLELTKRDVESTVFLKGLDEMIELINEEKIDLKVTRREKGVSVAHIIRNGDGEVMDVPAALLPTGAVKVKTVSQASSWASALKAPAKSNEAPRKTNNNNNHCTNNNFVVKSDLPMQSNNSPVKALTPDSPERTFTNRPTELPLKPDYSHNKVLGSPGKPAFNQVKQLDSPSRSGFNQVKQLDSPSKSAFNQVKPSDKPAMNHVKPADRTSSSELSSSPTSNYIKPIDPPMKSSTSNGHSIKSDISNQSLATNVIGESIKSTKSADATTKPNVAVVGKADSFTRDISPPSIQKQKKHNSPVEISSEEPLKQNFGESEKIIEELKKQLLEKTKLLESYASNPQQGRAYESELTIESLPVGSLYKPPTENTNEIVSEKIANSDCVCHIEEDVSIPKVSCNDVGGYSKEISEIRSLLDLPLHHADLLNNICIKPPRGVLLWGPHGTGKTLIARAIANESKVYVNEIFGPSLVSKHLEGCNTILKSVFHKIVKNAPSILILDQLDTIAPRNTCGENKMVALLLSLLNSLKTNVIVISTAQTSYNIDPTLKQAGLFDKEINIGTPDATGRLEVLRAVTKKLNLSKGVCLNRLSEETDGYTGGDLVRLCSQAGINGIKTKVAASTGSISKDMHESLKKLTLKMSDFKHALETSKPLIDEPVCKIPTTTWKDICGMEETKKQLNKFDFAEDTSLKGILLHGARGCGKLSFAKALANQLQYKFLAVKGYQLSTADIGGIFTKVRKCAPCILFISDIDLATCSTNSSLLKEMLLEIDNITDGEKTYIVAATHRCEDVHPALIRNLRVVSIPPADTMARQLILEREMKNKGAILDIDCEIEDIVQHTDGCTAIQLQQLVHTVCKAAGKQHGKKGADVVPLTTNQHFVDAMKSILPSHSRHFDKQGSKVATQTTSLECTKPTEVSQVDQTSKTKTSQPESQTVPEVSREVPTTNYLMFLGIFTLACFVYLLLVYLYTAMRY